MKDTRHFTFRFWPGGPYLLRHGMTHRWFYCRDCLHMYALRHPVASWRKLRTGEVS